MTIRGMTVADYAAVYALWQATPGMGLNDTDDSHEGIARFLARTPGLCFVAEEDSIVGSVLCGHNGRRATVYHLCVSAAHQYAGIARLLLGRVTAALKAQGIGKVNLVCFGTNTPGNAFWQHMGWQKRSDLNYYDLSLDVSSY